MAPGSHPRKPACAGPTTPQCCQPGPPPGGLSRAQHLFHTASSCCLTCPQLAFSSPTGQAEATRSGCPEAPSPMTVPQRLAVSVHLAGTLPRGQWQGRSVQEGACLQLYCLGLGLEAVKECPQHGQCPGLHSRAWARHVNLPGGLGAAVQGGAASTCDAATVAVPAVQALAPRPPERRPAGDARPPGPAGAGLADDTAAVAAAESRGQWQQGQPGTAPAVVPMSSPRPHGQQAGIGQACRALPLPQGLQGC